MSEKLEQMIADLETALNEAETKVSADTSGRILRVIDRYEAKGLGVPRNLKSRAHRLSEIAAEDMFDNMPV